MPQEEDVVAEVVRLELRLLDPAVRADVETTRALLHPAFVEHGASGRAWGRDDVTAAIAADAAVPGPVGSVVGARLAEDVVLVTYRITGPRGSLRSSVWVRDPGLGWRMRFHQGTRSLPPA